MRCYCDWADRDWTLFAYHLLNQHSFLIQVPDDTPNPVNVVREVIGQAMKAGEIPRRNVDLAAAAAIGVVLQPATYKVYGRFTGPLSATSASSPTPPGRCWRSRRSDASLARNFPGKKEQARRSVASVAN